ncbi:hypothetical protein GRI89_04115 [Altererythrobacter salegens]|uniref:Uncharacterized protein n=1 Tax=Croceibacterium salegens TaxID=1737568 RepID=A0A6I4SSB1_9SPHN|nr:hypothetical protein [Croceibacterium salegens]MXO58725.1 hypothetical protein [Croceibacterium salegens]
MTEERITEVRGPEGESPTTHTTVISGGPKSGGTGWALVIVLVLAVIAGLWMFSTMGGAEMAKDDAVAQAAEEVGNAANSVGDAAQKAADAITE